MAAFVVSVSRDAAHAFSKPVRASITLVAGLGVERDAHMGATVRHRSRVRQDPTQPNLRQVHLLHAELHGVIAVVLAGGEVRAGDAIRIELPAGPPRRLERV